MGDSVGYVALGGLIVTVIGAVVGAIVRLSGNWFSQRQEGEKTTIAGLWGVINGLKEEVEFQRQQRIASDTENEKRIRDLERDHTECQATRWRMVAWIETAEDAMTTAGIRFRPWSETPSNPPTGTHSSLPAAKPTESKP
jgi:hypothetical protein